MTTLKNVLLLNGLSSAATGLALLFFAPGLASSFDISHLEALYGVGVFLLLFGSMVFFESRKKTARAKVVLVITALDVLWVLASVVIVLAGVFVLSTIAYVVIAAVAVWVALMAYLQTKGLKQLLA